MDRDVLTTRLRCLERTARMYGRASGAVRTIVAINAYLLVGTILGALTMVATAIWSPEALSFISCAGVWSCMLSVIVIHSWLRLAAVAQLRSHLGLYLSALVENVDSPDDAWDVLQRQGAPDRVPGWDDLGVAMRRLPAWLRRRVESTGETFAAGLFEGAPVFHDLLHNEDDTP